MGSRPPNPAPHREQTADTAAFRQSLLEILEANPADEEALLEKFERGEKEGQPLYSSLLYILTHLSFSEAEGRRHWRRVVAHRDLLRMELGRNVGLRVALLDYFVNVSRDLKSPKVIEISIYEKTARSAVTDGLTNLFNHAHFLQLLKREIRRSRRYQGTFSLLLFDLDDFKKINDSRGHLEGDRVLVKTAALIQECLRDVDLAARYGGEEFAALLPDTKASGAALVAGRIRSRVSDHFRRSKAGGRVTLSGGIATFPDDAADGEELVRRADLGLYRSKAEGKNRITHVEEERRQHRRVLTSSRVTVRPRSGPEALARAQNFSEGGLLLDLKEPVPVGSPLNLLLRPAGTSESLGLPAEAVRVDRLEDGRYHVGVRFIDAPAVSLDVLRRLSASKN